MRRTWLVALTLAGIAVAGWSVRSEAKEGTEKGKRPRAFLGVLLSGEMPEGETGVRVDGIVDDSAADQAKLEEGDVIVSFDGRPVDGYGDLGRQLRNAAPEDRVDIEVLRDGRRQTVDVTLGERPLDEAPFLDMGRPRLGVLLVGTTPELREHLGGDRDRGVLVGKVKPDSPAEKAGLAVGDLITAVNGESVRRAADLMAAMRDEDGESLDLEVVRDQRTLHLKATLDASRD